MDKLSSLKEQVLPLLMPHAPVRVAVFGSYARDQEKPGSDIDLLVAFEAPLGLFALSRLRRQLEERTGKKIDLVTEGGLSPHLMPYIKQNRKVLYQKP